MFFLYKIIKLRKVLYIYEAIHELFIFFGCFEISSKKINHCTKCNLNNLIKKIQLSPKNNDLCNIWYSSRIFASNHIKPAIYETKRECLMKTWKYTIIFTYKKVNIVIEQLNLFISYFFFRFSKL